MTAMASDHGNQGEPLAVTQVEAAKRLTVSDRTIRNWERQGKLTGKRVGGVKLYPYADLKKLAKVK